MSNLQEHEQVSLNRKCLGLTTKTSHARRSWRRPRAAVCGGGRTAGRFVYPGSLAAAQHSRAPLQYDFGPRAISRTTRSFDVDSALALCARRAIRSHGAGRNRSEDAISKTDGSITLPDLTAGPTYLYGSHSRRSVGSAASATLYRWSRLLVGALPEP